MTSRRTKQSVSFRFSADLLTALNQRSEDVRSSKTELAERYITEGIRQDEHPLIGFRDGAAGRRPVLLGSRLAVADVISTLRQNDNSISETAEYLEVPVEQIEAALHYYADFQDEIEEWLARAAVSAARERERCERRRAAFS
jgi:uncharacterized protein (DUF433 family)